MTDIFWRRRTSLGEGEQFISYYYGPRGDAENSQSMTKEAWDSRRTNSREGTFGGRWDRNFDGTDDRTQPNIRNDPTYYPQGSPRLLEETNLSTFDQIERVVYAAGLWSEGILKGTVLILGPVLMIAIATGLTMAIIRIGVRGTERLLPVRRCD